MRHPLATPPERAALSYNPGIQLLTCNTAALGPWWNHDRFTAPYWRLYWNARPGAAVVLAGQTVPLLPTHFVLIPPETPFAGRCSGAAPQLYLHFLAQSPYDSAEPAIHRIRADGLLLRLVKRLAAMGPVSSTGVLAEGEVGRAPAMAALTIIHAALSELPEQSLRPVSTDPRVLRVLDAMDKPSESVMRNEDFATMAGMSPNAFIRLFRTVMHQTPQALYTRKRIERTCMQLHFTDLSIEAIAASAGFCDRYHFSRAFRRLRGMGPAAFRCQVGRHPA